MTLKVTVPNTSSDSLTFGSANTPTAAQVIGIDSGSSNGQLAFNTTASGTSTERMRIDSSGRVGIGTTSPGSNLDVVASTSGGQVTAAIRNLSNTSNSDARLYIEAYSSSRFAYTQYGVNGVGSWNTGYDVASGSYRISNDGGGSLNTSTRLVIGSNGAVGIGSTSNGSGLTIANVGNNGWLMNTIAPVGTNYTHIVFTNSNGNVGSVTTNGSTTAFNTSSDYRLKHDVQPMTGALAKVAALKPVTYKWNADDSEGEGFIAHELQEVVPDCVTGEKDAVDADGNPVYQGIDTSFLVATLTAAIQEQQAIIEQLTNRITALEAK